MTIKEKIIEIISIAKNPLYREEISDILGLHGREARILFNTLKEMEKEKLIIKDAENRYTIMKNEKLFEGIVDMTERGYAFVIVDGRDEDIFVREEDLNTAMNNDTVIVELKEKSEAQDKKDEGIIIKIQKRGVEKFVGKFQKIGKDDFAFVVPDDRSLSPDVFIKEKNFNGAKDGQKVQVKITKYPKGDKKPEGKIIDILGYPGDKGIDVLSVALNHDIEMEFSEETLKDAKKLPQKIKKSDAKNRLDFREKVIFTIDGKDAKDLDDAVSLERCENGNFELGVHIADVSAYVKENSALDKDAKKRGNSVYLLDRVVPMLPKELSNGICSLNEGEDRLALSVIMEIDKKGDVKNSYIAETIINSKKRLVYDDVSDYLEKDDQKAKEKLGVTAEPLLQMKELSEILYKKRHDKGAIDFDFQESEIILDENGTPVDIKKSERRTANKIIEEFMLITNETVSEIYYWAELPFLYRIHEYPDEEKLESFIKFIRGLGYSIKGEQNEIHPKALQEVLEKVKGEKEEAIVNRLMLRSLKKARYSEINDIHFGLSSQYYSHFTAPIRRYPDLQIHRIIKENINGKLDEKRIEHYDKILPEVAKHTSDTERTAEEAEREVEKIKKAEYMKNFVGEEYPAIISGITAFGIFAELENTVEGLIRYSTMEDDYYEYDEENITAVGKDTGHIYHLGDKINIKVSNVEVERSEIDFVIMGEQNG